MNNIRREQMYEYIKSKKAVSLKELIKMFSNVSPMTIHRDLDYMEKEGKIERVRGGAKYIDEDKSNRETPITDRILTNINEKRIIGYKAAGLVKSGSCIYIDGGSTGLALARQIKNMPLNVITNGPNIAMSFTDRNLINVTLSGGILEKENSTLFGYTALQTIEKINIDTAFVAASAYSEKSGFTCGKETNAELKNHVCKNARKVVMLIDSSKFDMVYPLTFATLDDIDCLVSEKELDKEFLAKLKEKNIEVL